MDPHSSLHPYSDHLLLNSSMGFADALDKVTPASAERDQANDTCRNAKRGDGIHPLTSILMASTTIEINLQM